MNWVYIVLVALLLAAPQLGYTLQDLYHGGDGYAITTAQPNGYLPLGTPLNIRYGDGSCHQLIVQGYVHWYRPPRPIIDYFLVLPDNSAWFFVTPPVQNVCA